MKEQYKKNGMDLRVPANEKWQLVVRMALGGAGALLGLNVDVLDDLRALADEACDCLMHQKQKLESLRILCYQQDDQLHAVFIGEREESQVRQAAQLDIQMVNCILETLAVDTDVQQDEQGAWKIEVVLPIEKQ